VSQTAYQIEFTQDTIPLATAGRLQSPFLNRQVRQDRQGREKSGRKTAVFSTWFLGALGVLGGFSDFAVRLLATAATPY